MKILHLYPPEWRARYEDEVLAVLEAHGLSLRTRIDLLRGALDAWLFSRRSAMSPSGPPRPIPSIRILGIPALFAAAHWISWIFWLDSFVAPFTWATVLSWVGVCFLAGRELEPYTPTAKQAALKGVRTGVLAWVLVWAVTNLLLIVGFAGIHEWAAGSHWGGGQWEHPGLFVVGRLLQLPILAFVSGAFGAALAVLGLKTGRWALRAPITIH